MTTRRFFGETLPNSATVIEQRGEFVLCHIDWGSDPFVTWRVSASGEAESGHYFRDVVAAAKDLSYRAGEGEPTTDPTEQGRRDRLARRGGARRAEAEAAGERIWDTEALRADFEVRGFMAPYVVVRRRADGVEGVLEFTHHPRVYFGFREEG